MRLLSTLLILLIFTSCYQVERNCSKFKTGTFQFEAVSGTEIFTTRIIRNDSMEIEYFKDQVDTATVRWINDCEYILQKLNPKNKAEKKAIHIKILTTDKNTYTFEFKAIGNSSRSKATATKISN